MPPPRPLGLAPEWDERTTRMVGLSAVAHVVAIAALVIVAERAAPRPLPLVAYTVELTDANAFGGRLPGGAPGRDLSGGPTQPVTPEPEGPPAPPPEAKTESSPPSPPVAKAEPEPPPPEAKVEPPPPPAAKVEPTPPPPEAKADPAPPPEPKAEPAPPPKPEPPKEEAKKPDAPKPEAKKPEPAKAEPTKPKSQAAEPAKPGVAPPKKPASSAPGAATAASESGPARDAYAAAAERWRTRAGGGLGGEDTGSGPIGSGGQGAGGGGQLVGIEFLAYRQKVIDTIKARWTNVIARPGLVAAVRFQIAPDGEVSDIRLVRPSGNGAYDGSALRAVQHVSRLPAPPARYANDFREFQIEFHSEERGGGTG